MSKFVVYGASSNFQATTFMISRPKMFLVVGEDRASLKVIENMHI